MAAVLLGAVIALMFFSNRGARSTLCSKALGSGGRTDAIDLPHPSSLSVFVRVGPAVREVEESPRETLGGVDDMKVGDVSTTPRDGARPTGCERGRETRAQAKCALFIGGRQMRETLARDIRLPKVTQMKTHRFVHILHSYAVAHWLGIARTADFKTVIAEVAVRLLPGFDVEALWTRWRVT